MKCPQCGGTDLSVQDSRSGDSEVRRRRVCAGCGVRYVTVERIEDVYVAAGPGRPRGINYSAKRQATKTGDEVVAKTKSAGKRRAEARRKIEDMKDTFEEDYSMYDDLAEVGHLWK